MRVAMALWAAASAGCAVVDQLPEAAPSIAYVQVPGGTFAMGSPPDEEGRVANEGPQHEVSVSAFELGKYEVTNAEYARFLKANPSVELPAHWHADSLPLAEPAVAMTWAEASQFASWVGARLPTEAQWEYAARAGTSGARYGELDAIAWHRANSDDLKHEVGTKQPNDWGVFDMLGNVYEWVADGPEEYGDGTAGAPIGGDDGNRVLRGGSFDDPDSSARAAFRLIRSGDRRVTDFGFRVARERR